MSSPSSSDSAASTPQSYAKVASNKSVEKDNPISNQATSSNVSDEAKRSVHTDNAVALHLDSSPASSSPSTVPLASHSIDPSSSQLDQTEHQLASGSPSYGYTNSQLHQASHRGKNRKKQHGYGYGPMNMHDGNIMHFNQHNNNGNHTQQHRHPNNNQHNANQYYNTSRSNPPGHFYNSQSHIRNTNAPRNRSHSNHNNGNLSPQQQHQQQQQQNHSHQQHVAQQMHTNHSNSNPQMHAYNTSSINSHSPYQMPQNSGNLPPGYNLPVQMHIPQQYFYQMQPSFHPGMQANMQASQNALQGTMQTIQPGLSLLQNSQIQAMRGFPQQQMQFANFNQYYPMLPVTMTGQSPLLFSSIQNVMPVSYNTAGISSTSAVSSPQLQPASQASIEQETLLRTMQAMSIAAHPSDKPPTTALSVETSSAASTLTDSSNSTLSISPSTSTESSPSTPTQRPSSVKNVATVHPKLPEAGPSTIHSESSNDSAQAKQSPLLSPETVTNSPSQSYASSTSSEMALGAILEENRPYFSIDVECVATGVTHNDRSIAQIALVDQHERVLLNLYVKQTLPVVSYLTPLSGITAEILQVHGVPIEIAIELLTRTLPSNAVLVGQNILKDVDWLGLKEGFHFHSLLDLSGLWRAKHPNFGSYTFFSLAHEARALLNFQHPEPHNAVVDSIVSIRLFKYYQQCHLDRASMERAHQSLFSTPLEPSFAKRFPIFEGVCMGARKACKCGAPFFY